MSVLFAALLGLIQGITEFLPVSSSGHLAVFQYFFGMKKVDTFFDVLLHLATLIAVCIVYWQDIVDMVREFFGFFHDLRHPKPEGDKPSSARRLLLMIIIATLPLFLVLPFNSKIENLSNNMYFIGIAFLITGGILFMSDKLQHGRRTEKNMSIGNALTIGVCQAVATLPGISRSGSTISAGMAVGLNRSFAVKFSFLLSLPAILGANIISLIGALKVGIDVSLLPAYLVGMLVAGVSGYFAIGLVKMLAQKGKFGKICYYCFIAGIVTLVLKIIL